MYKGSFVYIHLETSEKPGKNTCLLYALKCALAASGCCAGTEQNEIGRK